MASLSSEHEARAEVPTGAPSGATIEETTVSFLPLFLGEHEPSPFIPMFTLDSHGRTIWIADAHRSGGKRFVVHADEKLTAFLELQAAIL
jgi:hypothetical protein